MKRTAFCATLVIGLFLVGPATGADDPLVLKVWPGKAAGDYGTIGAERIRAPSEAPTKNAKWITNVTTPTITVYRPAKEKNTGAAMLICPGGGYWNLAWDLEGEEVAAWLNTVGMTGIVLKYRVPRRPGQPEPLPAPGPLLDAQRALSLVRNRAKEWEIDPQRIGIVGFSAGGHLAVMTATYFDKRGYEPIDEIDKVSCRPDFAVAVYPGYLVPEDKDTDVLASYIRIPEGTPPIFLVHASDDPESGPQHSASMYLALRRAHVPAELHIYATGGHGFGVRKSSKPCSTWTDRCVAWLRSQKILDAIHDEPEAKQVPAALPEGDKGIAAKYPDDVGIEADSAVIFHDDFESGSLRDRWDNVYHGTNIRMADEPPNVHGGKKALEFTIPKQRAEVSNEVIKRLDRGYDVVFLRYYSRFEKGFDQVGSSHNGGFLAAIAPGVPFATPGVRADGRNKFIASFENWRGDAGTPSPGELNVYCYHPAQRSQWGDHFFPSGKVLPNSYRPGDFGPHFTSRSDITPELDRWYCFEFMLQANDVNQPNGRIACWVDGKLIADFPHLRFRDLEALKINFAALDLHIGNNTARVNKKWYDDVVIATSYIGPVFKQK
jgi:acetyl esterase/lipase